MYQIICLFVYLLYYINFAVLTCAQLHHVFTQRFTESPQSADLSIQIAQLQILKREGINFISSHMLQLASWNDHLLNCRMDF